MKRSEDPIDEIQRAWLRERPGTAVEPMGVLTRIRYIAKLLEDDHRRIAARLGVDPPTRDLLSTLRRAGPPYRLSPGEIAQRSLLTAGAVTQRVARAEREGLVRRRRAGDDGRAVVVELTRAGHDLVERTLDELLRHEEQLLAGVTPAARRRLERDLRSLLNALVE